MTNFTQKFFVLTECSLRNDLVITAFHREAPWSRGERQGLTVWAMVLGREFDSNVHLKTRWIRRTTWWQQNKNNKDSQKGQVTPNKYIKRYNLALLFSGRPKHVCILCQRTFKRSDNLTAHYRFVKAQFECYPGHRSLKTRINLSAVQYLPSKK